MIRSLAALCLVGLYFTAPTSGLQEIEEGRPEAGVALPRPALGPGVIETVETVLERIEARGEGQAMLLRKARGNDQGAWVVPSRRGTYRPHSGEHAVINEWGDTRMGIGFPEAVNLHGAWISGQASPGAWTESLVVVGYRAGLEVDRTERFTDIGSSPTWFPMDLEAVDRVEFLADPVLDGGGWYALDDLTFEVSPFDTLAEEPHSIVVVDFDDLPWRTRLTGTGYAGLDWEVGQGDFRSEPRVIPAPVTPEASGAEVQAGSGAPAPSGPGTLPVIMSDFRAMQMFENGTAAIPADTCGAIGPEHFASVVNVKLAVFDRTDGTRLFEAPLADFFNTTALGDPRITYDHHDDRWFLLASSGPSTARIYVAISLTGDPTGPWFKSYIDTAVGDDVGRWPDYPTLGFDAHGYYTTALMVPNTMTLWAIDKAPLLTGSPSLGTVTAWRNRPFEGAIQPCVTHGDSGGQLFVSRRDADRLRIRKLHGSLTSPTLSTVGHVTVPANSTPPDAPALGSLTDLSTGDTRPMNAVYRDGSIYTAHTIDVDGRAACRWYELDVASVTALQIGTIADPVRSYFYPSVSVNADHHLVLGFSGSHAREYAGAFYTGHHAFDPPGATAPPALLRAGGGPYNHVDSNGAARWGDYSLTSIDPLDDSGFWTIQGYARMNNKWGTWVTELAFASPCPASWSTCSSSPNSVGPGASMASSGTTSLSLNDLVLESNAAVPGQNGVFFFGPTETSQPFGAGTLCVTGGIVRLAVVGIDGLGTASSSFDVSSQPQIGAGSTRFFQFWYRDPAGGGAGFNLSDALGATFCP